MAGHLLVARFFCVWWITARTGHNARSKRDRNARLIHPTTGEVEFCRVDKRSAIHQRAGQAVEDFRIYRYPVEVDVNVNG